ncbi:NADH-quinone oxidoreductase subunit NuoF [Rhodococcus triatomae]|uniref:NADH-quinone oxidoreductase subunit F n=1 Tax=Rhodococcus triatomae TaxID=300028 RepID=A0A1G8QVJ7_9NOCA|nr:NADH-quinone oxidoreductase subunit NuoF [Rhodococcus triatomae]QNG20774.1 NADH-quinone oxidoreductase subunit NuoF [Rhodococcus triatomae]QNG23310.1 NADH-quinone oxidoreductase subunit NuoF [Rhodococcus triatomae]SDJ08691.1 NADH-quinone oxidoreductase subunit F [Rhodococcus triatomae]
MSDPVFVALGPRPEEPAQVFRPGARRSYPPEVRDRLGVDAKEILGRYPQPRSALLPLLHLVQSEDGYITPAGIEFCADLLALSGAEVLAVASFYSMYRREETGRYLVGVCTNTLCAVMGGDAILDSLSHHLGVEPGETTADGAVTLEHLECNAACDYAPVVMVNWEFFDDQTVDSALALVDELREGAPVTPSRGAPLCSFRETSRVLAGFPDPRPGAVDAAPPGAATLAGLEVARERETALTPVLSEYWDEERSWTLDAYRGHDGYRGLQIALDMHPDQVIAQVKDAGLRGRGGAGFPTGVKWGFIPQSGTDPTRPGDGVPHYLVVNADESEPGTCKDMPLMLANPHALVEGAIIAAYAIRANHAFIYLRGEVVPVLRRLHEAVAQAYDAGYLGRNILDSGYDLELVVHAGAGAYICGEETALLDSLEGRRGQPRLRPPFPAVAGLYASPTVVNNVESIASVPSILVRGGEWFRSLGTEKSPGFTLYSLSGHVTRPGQYEAPLGITLRELLDYAGGVRGGHRLKFWTPGGSSTPLFTDEHLDVPLDYEGVAAAGSMLGTKALQIFDETTCVVRAVLRWTEFYAHESCGKCTPCREGTYWLVQILRRLEAGEGDAEDLTKLLDISDAVLGKSFCALGDGAASPIMSSLQYFRDEYVAHFEGRGCPFDPDASRLAPQPLREV